MAYSGLPRRKYTLQEGHGRKSYLYYARRRQQHLESGPTLPQYTPNTNISAASVRGKWERQSLLPEQAYSTMKVTADAHY